MQYLNQEDIEIGFIKYFNIMLDETQIKAIIDKLCYGNIIDIEYKYIYD